MYKCFTIIAIQRQDSNEEL